MDAMIYAPDVKARAYEIDPTAWKSYSGRPVVFKRAIEERRIAALDLAYREANANHFDTTELSRDEVMPLMRMLLDIPCPRKIKFILTGNPSRNDSWVRDRFARFGKED